MTKEKQFFEKGKNYFVRTVTMYYAGKLVSANDKEIVLTNCAWIADTGRFTQALESGNFNEVELFPTKANVLINRGAMLDAHKITFALPNNQK